MFYGSEQEYLGAVVPFVADGLGKGESVQVAVPSHNLALLRDALGGAAAEVTMVDASSTLRNPARNLALMNAFAAAKVGRPVRMVGEGVWPGRTVEEYAAWVEHEALVNTAFDGRAVVGMGLCPYDTRRLDEHDADVLADARATHPLLWQTGAQTPNPEFAPEQALARYDRPLVRHPQAVGAVVADVAELAGLRAFIAWHAERFGLGADGIADLQIIVTELATNSLEHGGAACDLALWPHNGYLVCEASDGGRLADRLAGRRPPTPGAIGGYGLWTVNALSDLFRIHASPAGTTIQAYRRVRTL